MDSGHIDPNDAGVGPGGPEQQEAHLSDQGGYPGWRMKLGNNLFEMFFALWNFLGWKFKGDVDIGKVVDPEQIQEDPKQVLEHDKHELAKKAYLIKGRFVPRFYSPVYWIHLLYAVTFHCHFFLTKIGRTYFELYYNVFLAGEEDRKNFEREVKGKEDPNMILLPFNDKKSDLWNSIRAKVIMYTRMDEYYLDVSRCDKEWEGNFSAYLAEKFLKQFILRPAIILEFPFFVYDRNVKNRSISEIKGLYFRLKESLGLDRKGAMFIYSLFSIILWFLVMWGVSQIF